MTRFSIDLLPQAEAEIREAFLWYFARSPLAANEFRTEVLDAIDGLGETADTWPEDESGFRYYVLRHFPYTVHYEFEERRATVIAVAHQRREPGYWHDR
ncbi:MAG: type II toxin-antitoxin system RelE/ParE family toxin [Burkholderiales bacterium]